jgi:hypothetical protein
LGLFSFVGSMLGASSQKKAVKKATKQQVAARQGDCRAVGRQFDITNKNFRALSRHWREGPAGLGDLTGVNGADAQAAVAIEALKASPFYQSLFRTGEEAVLQDASATGGLRAATLSAALRISAPTR